MPQQLSPPPFVPLYSAFAAGYMLSYFYRTMNAVISPDLTRDLDLHPGQLGLITSAYLVAFAVLQIPVGVLLDRYGPRRVEPILLAIAGCGAVAFALAQGLPGLVLARALIGAGVAACLMAPLKGLSLWYPVERHASLMGWIMTAGGVGALAATAPLDLLLRVAGWRDIFLGLGVCTFAVALWLWWKIPEAPAGAGTATLKEQLGAVQRIYASARFWWLAPLAGMAMGAFMAIQGLWAVPWMMQVQGLSRAEAARYLLAIGIVVLMGYIALGLFATVLDRRGVKPRHLFAAGFALNVVSLALIIAGMPGSMLWWVLYGLGSGANILSFRVVNDGFAPELAARVNTAMNLVMFCGSFVTQWGIGIVMDLGQAAGLDAAGGLRRAFLLVLGVNLLGLAWFFRGWKRHAVHAAQFVPVR